LIRNVLGRQQNTRDKPTTSARQLVKRRLRKIRRGMRNSKEDHPRTSMVLTALRSSSMVTNAMYKLFARLMKFYNFVWHMAGTDWLPDFNVKDHAARSE
jgi:hypothetical protein